MLPKDIFFDYKTLNLIGWQTKDIYQNLVITFIYNVKKNLEKIIANFISTEIEWVPLNNVEVNKENKDNVVDFLETLEEDDDVQNVYSNVNLGGI